MTLCGRVFRLYVASWIMLAVFSVGLSAQPQLPPGVGDSRVGLQAGLSPSLLKNGPLGELLAVYTPRDRDEIQRLLSLSRSEQETAVNDIAASRRLSDEADGRARITSDEVKTTKTRLDVAKKGKEKTDQVALEMELKRQEAELQYVERLRDAHRADSDWLQSQSVATAAHVKALELEADVARKFDEVSLARDPNASEIANYREILKRMLLAQQEAADRGADATSKQKVASQRRLKQLDTLTKLKN